MDKVIYLLVLCIHVTWGAIGNDKCEDCMPIMQCPEALPYITNVTDEKLQYISSFYCGITSSFNVCCSKFSSRPEDTKLGHPNLKLLPDSCGDIYNSIGLRITAGIFASMYEFPWMVVILYNTNNGLKYQCSGTLINSRYVLTAAHCIQNKDIVNVRVGEYEIGQTVDCVDEVCESNLQDIEVEDTIIHENYTKYKNYVNDIGLIRLVKNVNMTFRNTGYICLPLSEDLQSKSISGLYGIAAGWGYTEFLKDSNRLLKVNLLVHSNERCEEFYSYMSPVELNKICAGTLRKDTCSGDSGGPLMVDGYYKGKSKYIQFGIVSSGPTQCGSERPGLYTDVRKYIPWILDNIKE